MYWKIIDKLKPYVTISAVASLSILVLLWFLDSMVFKMDAVFFAVAYVPMTLLFFIVPPLFFIISISNIYYIKKYQQDYPTLKMKSWLLAISVYGIIRFLKSEDIGAGIVSIAGFVLATYLLHYYLYKR